MRIILYCSLYFAALLQSIVMISYGISNHLSGNAFKTQEVSTTTTTTTTHTHTHTHRFYSLCFLHSTAKSLHGAESFWKLTVA
jgi:hypothetical protein